MDRLEMTRPQIFRDSTIALLFMLEQLEVLEEGQDDVPTIAEFLDQVSLWVETLETAITNMVYAFGLNQTELDELVSDRDSIIDARAAGMEDQAIRAMLVARWEIEDSPHG